MRPFGEEAPGRRPRVSDSDLPTSFQGAQPQQSMSFCIGDESVVDIAVENSPHRRCRDHSKHALDANAEPGATAGSMPPKPAVHGHNYGDASVLTGATDCGTHADGISTSSGSPLSKANLTAPSTNPALSQPLTPVMLGPSGPASAFSGVSSRRNSLTASLSEEMGSQVLSISDDFEPDQSSSMMESGSAPQLVMPSIEMPSRRPFTEEGKRIGRLKVLIAGDSGIGKTSLLKAIVQSCDHLVHVDPIAPQHVYPASRPNPRPRRPKSPKSSNPTGQITEIFASTKPYPSWWSDLDESRVLQRRKSLGDTVLDRNICFLDTPGYAQGSSCMETITPVIRYIESHFERVQANASTDSDLLNMLGGDGGSQVDVVFYLIRNQLRPVDLQYMRLLTRLTNVIPLLAQADTMSSEDITNSKTHIKRALWEAGIRPFSFSVSSSGAMDDSQVPYAISSTPGSDHDIMDASLLMSPDYVQPLIPSELSSLVEQVFCENGASWLRHAAGQKYLQWRDQDNPSRPQKALYKPMSLPAGPSSSLVAAATMTVSPMGATSAYSLARITDHTLREERLAQIRLANWASELQRSLANERARYEGLARSERSIWLTERLNECVQDGTLVAVGGRDRSRSRPSDSMRRKLAGEHGQGRGSMSHRDPLGLLQVSANLKAKGWVALEILGGLGVLGGLYWHFQAYDWAIAEWSRFWYGDR